MASLKVNRGRTLARSQALQIAIDAQVGVEVECVNICIDSLVFPKE